MLCSPSLRQTLVRFTHESILPKPDSGVFSFQVSERLRAVLAHVSARYSAELRADCPDSDDADAGARRGPDWETEVQLTRLALRLCCGAAEREEDGKRGSGRKRSHDEVGEGDLNAEMDAWAAESGDEKRQRRANGTWFNGERNYVTS